jgi:hypothetical protein
MLVEATVYEYFLFKTCTTGIAKLLSVYHYLCVCWYHAFIDIQFLCACNCLYVYIKHWRWCVHTESVVQTERTKFDT